jgi:Rhodopirellula transposase DDE domain
MRQEVRWTDLNYEQIAEHLAEAGTPVSVPVVKQLLDNYDYVTRKAQKSKAMGGHRDRNQQFENSGRSQQTCDTLYSVRGVRVRAHQPMGEPRPSKPRFSGFHPTRAG